MPQPDPFISIVIPSYNRATFLEKNIPELLKLNYSKYELIVVDDGSTDNTGEVFDRITAPNLSYYKKQNAERAAARNYGADRAKGDYITFLDSDDVLYPDALQNGADALREKDYPDFLHLAYEIGTETCLSKLINNISDDNPLIMVEGNPLSCMGIFLKRDIFQHHRFNEDRALSASEDWEFWVRLAANYGLRTDNRVVGRLIEHDSRSVVTASEEKLVKRKDLAMKYAFEDPAVQKVYGRYKAIMEAHWDTYIALHLAIDGIKDRALYHFRAGISKAPSVFFTKRGLVICKLLLLKKSAKH